MNKKWSTQATHVSPNLGLCVFPESHEIWWSLWSRRKLAVRFQLVQKRPRLGARYLRTDETSGEIRAAAELATNTFQHGMDVAWDGGGCGCYWRTILLTIRISRVYYELGSFDDNCAGFGHDFLELSSSKDIKFNFEYIVEFSPPDRTRVIY